MTGFLGNFAAATNATNDEGNGQRNYLRTLAPFSPEMLAAFPQRLRSNRNNPYIEPKGYKRLKSGLQVFNPDNCSSGINAILDPNAASNPDFNEHTEGDVDPGPGPARPDQGVRLRRAGGVELRSRSRRACSRRRSRRSAERSRSSASTSTSSRSSTRPERLSAV